MDDSMEISSEHGHNMRDEDIDIDIDLTTTHVDEDYVLEDALPPQIAESDFVFEASPAPANDDLMVDEDDETYHANHIDTDFIPDNQNQNMTDQTTDVPFPTTTGPEVYSEDHEAPDTDHFEVASSKETRITDPQDTAHDSVVDQDLQPQDHNELAVTEEDHANVGDATEAAADSPEIESDETNPQPTSPHLSSKAPTVTEEPSAPAAALLEPTHETPHHTSHNDQLDAMTSHEPEEESHMSSDEAHQIEAHALATAEILVIYQEAEYALFSTSELDDPDSFFLSDTSILDSPISHFLKAIRNVIHEDLASEDELCLSIGDMGLEVEETSTSIQDITLRQVVTLYEKLVGNDGVVSPQPFCIQLGVRPGFAKRLAKFVAGAAEGKGLSEFVFLAEPSNIRGESPHDAETHDNADDQANIEVPEHQEYEDEQKEHAGDSSDTPPPFPNPDTKPLNLAAKSLDEATPEQNDTSVRQPSEAKPSPNMNGNGHEDYEEDDLIDYSDEEVDTVDKHQKSGEVVHDGVIQESVPSAPSDSLHEQSAMKSDAAHVQGHYEEKDGSIENGIEYHEGNDEPYYNEGDGHDDSQETSKATDVADTWEHEGNNQPTESQPQPRPNGKGQGGEVERDNLEDGIEYDDEDDAEAAQLPKLFDADLGLDVSENPLDDGHASNSEVEKMTRTENGTSDKSLDAYIIPDEVPEDEIDYDDDDDDSGVPETQTPLSDTKDDVVVPLDGSGKRQREDANLDEGLSVAGKDVKRRKS